MTKNPVTTSRFSDSGNSTRKEVDLGSCEPQGTETPLGFINRAPERFGRSAILFLIESFTIERRFELFARILDENTRIAKVVDCDLSGNEHKLRDPWE